MENHYIDYNLFRTRTGFDPLKFFENNKSISYEEFQRFLNAKKVKSPGRDYYDRAIRHVNVTPKVVSTPEPVIETPQVEIVQEPEKVVKQPATTRRRRGRKKKSND